MRVWKDGRYHQPPCTVRAALSMGINAPPKHMQGRIKAQAAVGDRLVKAWPPSRPPETRCPEPAPGRQGYRSSSTIQPFPESLPTRRRIHAGVLEHKQGGL